MNERGPLLRQRNSASSLIELVKSYGFTKYGPMTVVATNLIANVSANIATIGALESIVNNYVEDLGMEKSVLNKNVTLMGNSKSVAVLLTCIVSILAILFGPEKLVTNSGSLSFLLIFTLVCLMTYMTVDKKEKGKEKITIYNKEMNYKLCKLVSVIGMVLCSSGFGKLIYDIKSEKN